MSDQKAGEIVTQLQQIRELLETIAVIMYQNQNEDARKKAPPGVFPSRGPNRFQR
jgi:hypothetical protein